MKKSLIDLLGRIEVSRMKAQRDFDYFGEKYIGKKKYSKRKRKAKF